MKGIFVGMEEESLDFYAIYNFSHFIHWILGRKTIHPPCSDAGSDKANVQTNCVPSPETFSGPVEECVFGPLPGQTKDD